MISSKLAPIIERIKLFFFVMVPRLFLFVVVLPYMQMLMERQLYIDRLNRLILLYILINVNEKV